MLLIAVFVCFFKVDICREKAGTVQCTFPFYFSSICSDIMSISPKFLSPPALPWEWILTGRKSLAPVAADPVTHEGGSRIHEFSKGKEGQNFKGKFRTLINALNGIHYYLIHKKELENIDQHWTWLSAVFNDQSSPWNRSGWSLWGLSPTIAGLGANCTGTSVSTGCLAMAMLFWRVRHRFSMDTNNSVAVGFKSREHPLTYLIYKSKFSPSISVWLWVKHCCSVWFNNMNELWYQGKCSFLNKRKGSSG